MLPRSTNAAIEGRVAPCGRASDDVGMEAMLAVATVALTFADVADSEIRTWRTTPTHKPARRAPRAASVNTEVGRHS